MVSETRGCICYINYLFVVQARKASHEGVLKELEKVRDIYQHNLGGTDPSWEKKMADLCNQLLDYVSMKKDMSALYPP